MKTLVFDITERINRFHLGNSELLVQGFVEFSGSQETIWNIFTWKTCVFLWSLKVLCMYLCVYAKIRLQ